MSVGAPPAPESQATLSMYTTRGAGGTRGGPASGFLGRAYVTLARWCSAFPTKPDVAVDVKNKRCECGKRHPSFGLPEEGRGYVRWCSACPGKTGNAVGIHSKRCECSKRQPSFGPPGEGLRSARWRSTCPGQSGNAVNVRIKRCECRARQPGFGLLGEGRSSALVLHLPRQAR
eukprot:jgi/Tetstr1/440389/TSEL_028723.t1